MSKFDEWLKKREESIRAELPAYRDKSDNIYAVANKDGVSFWNRTMPIEDLLRLRDWITENFDN